MNASEGGSSTQPEHGWTCFHCGETFNTPGGARDHFGFEPSADPACRIKVGAERGLVMALRRAEQQLSDAWDAIHQENTEAARAYHAQQTRHSSQLMTVEEAGYERGLADGRAEQLGIEFSAAECSERLDLARSIAVIVCGPKPTEALTVKRWEERLADCQKAAACALARTADRRAA